VVFPRGRRWSSTVRRVSAAGVAGGGRGGLLREVVGLPAYRRWSATTQLVRLPLVMTPLAFLLLATAATGNYRLGGVMITAATVAEVVAASVVLGLLALAGAVSWPGVLLVALAVLSAGLTAGAPAGLRKVLATTVPNRLLAPALAVDGVLIEGTIVVGPLLVAAAATVAQIGGVALMAMTTATAAVLVRFLVRGSGLDAPPGGHVDDADGTGAVGGGSRLWSRPFAVWLGIGVVTAAGVGLAEVSALPLAQQTGGSTFTAVLLQAVLSLASAATGLLYGARSHRLPGTPLHRAVLLLAGLGVGVLVLTASATPGAGLGWILTGYLVVGAFTAPLVTTVLVTMQDLAPPRRAGEAFGLNSAATGVGFASAGAALAALPLPAALGSGLAGIAASLIAGLVLAAYRAPA